MAFADVEAKTTINGFSDADKATILGAMRTAYNGSATAKKMFDDFLATAGNKIDIQFDAGNFAAGVGTGKLFLDLSFLTDNTYITPEGKAVEDTAVTGIVHELGHALAGLRDDGDYKTDYKGATVDFVNKIYTELGLPEQVSYIAYDDTGNILKRDFEYTSGATIDRAVSFDRDWNSSDAGNSKDLLIGGPSNNTLQSSDGNDFLWGAGGDDNLNGGDGSGDTVGFKGSPTDYDIRLNSDGTWTSRHVRGDANEGTDTLSNLEKVQFEGGKTFDLKKEGLTFQTDFAFVIDTTGSMGDDIGAVKDNANTIINALFDGDTVDARVGVVSFKDNTIGEPTSIILPFTDQDQFADRKAAALAAINGITVGGGGDLPETAFDGLLKALDGTMGEWRPSAGVHRVALFTDASAKDGALASTVEALAKDIGATITPRSRAEGLSGSLDTFTFTPVDTSSFSGRDLSTDPDISLPPFVPSDDPVTPDTSEATLEIFTILTGGGGVDTSDLEDIAEATGGDFLTAVTPDDLVETLLEIIELPPEEPTPEVPTPITDTIVLSNNGANATGDGNDNTIVNGTFGLLSNGTPSPFPFQSAFSNVVNAGSGNDTIATGAGNDNIGGGNGNDTIGGGSGNDTIAGGAGNDNIGGGDGNDTIGGGSGNDTIGGGVGNDIIGGGAGNDNIGGGAGNDNIGGSVGNDTIAGGAGTDQIGGGTGNDNIGGGDGNDTIAGAAGDDTVFGGNGADRIGGGAGNDSIEGGAGNDTIFGGSGTDLIDGGVGSNQINLGFDGEADFVIINTADGGFNKITGFDVGVDKVVIQGATDFDFAPVDNELIVNDTIVARFDNTPGLGDILLG